MTKAECEIDAKGDLLLTYISPDNTNGEIEALEYEARKTGAENWTIVTNMPLQVEEMSVSSLLSELGPGEYRLRIVIMTFPGGS